MQQEVGVAVGNLRTTLTSAGRSVHPSRSLRCCHHCSTCKLRQMRGLEMQ